MAALVGIAFVVVCGQACSNDKAVDPKNDPRLLVIDGIEITFADLDPYYEFLTKNRPELGKKTKYVWAMREHVLPLKVAQRAFPKERAEQLARAKDLCEVATNIYELEQQSRLIEHKTRSNLTRQSAMLPVAMFAFEPENTNAVSPPLELAQGYFVVSTYELNESPLEIAGYVDALQVGFVTHTSKVWRTWWEEEQLTMGQKVTFVHPDYRDDLPPWMKLPKDQNP